VDRLGVLYQPRTGIKKWLTPLVQFPHKCLYDEPRLLEILGECGFEAEARRAFDSDIEDITAIELESRTDRAVIVEAKKLVSSQGATRV
jgi:hypothetical protein